MPKNLFANSPRQLRNRSEKPSTIFELDRNRYAIHGPGSEPEIVTDEPTEKSGSTIGPVYSLQAAGTTAVPTGRVFVRFKSGLKAIDRKRDIENAGYTIAETVEYAPEAIWVRDPSGDIAESLSGIAKLEELADVENVEPQMLMQRVSR